MGKTVVLDEECCVGCGACVELCPDVFEMNEDEEGARHPPGGRERGVHRRSHYNVPRRMYFLGRIGDPCPVVSSQRVLLQMRKERGQCFLASIPQKRNVSMKMRHGFP